MSPRVYTRTPPAERFECYVQRGEGCWEWRGAVNEKGYGRFFVGGTQSTSAHRFAHELWIGPVPERLWVLHRCDNPGCVRPEHLFLGTAKDNTADMLKKGRHRTRPRPLKTHCIRGHAFTPENTRILIAGHRRCLTCHRESAARAKLRDPERIREVNRRATKRYYERHKRTAVLV